LANTEATLHVKLDSEEAVRQLEDVLKNFDIVKKARELEFAVGQLERDFAKLLLRIAALEERVRTNEIWQEDHDRAGCEE